MLAKTTPVDEAHAVRTPRPRPASDVAAGGSPVCDVPGCEETDVVIGRTRTGRRTTWWTRCLEHAGDRVDPEQWDELAYW